MRRRLSSRSVHSSLSLRVLRSSGHGVWLTLVVGRGFSLHDQIKGDHLPQDYHTEGVSSSPEKRSCHPNCHRASIHVETSSEEEHSHSHLRKSEKKKSLSCGGESFRSARVLEASGPSTPITGQDRPVTL
jgi:hypothetical protein